MIGNLTKKSDVFSTLHLNICSLLKNNDQFIHFLTALRHEFSIIALAEIWLYDEIAELYNMSQYTSTFSNRKGRVGGFAIYVHNQYQLKLRMHLHLAIRTVPEHV